MKRLVVFGAISVIFFKTMACFSTMRIALALCRQVLVAKKDVRKRAAAHLHKDTQTLCTISCFFDKNSMTKNNVWVLKSPKGK